MSILDDYVAEQRRLATADVNRQVEAEAARARGEVQAMGERLFGMAAIGVGLIAIFVGREMLVGK